MQLLAHKNHKSELDAESLCMLGKKYKKAALAILKDPILLGKVAAPGILIKLCSPYAEAAEYILNNNKLLKRLNGTQTCTLVMNHPRLLHLVFTSPEKYKLFPRGVGTIEVAARTVPLLFKEVVSSICFDSCNFMLFHQTAELANKLHKRAMQLLGKEEKVVRKIAI